MSLGSAAEKLRAVGVETVGVIATAAAQARRYFSYRRPRYLVAADPDLTSHRAFGIPNTAVTEEMQIVVAAKADNLAHDEGLDAPTGGGWAALDREDRIDPTAFTQDKERHQAQLIGQFMIDREGIVRWSNIECERDGLEGLDRFPTDDELLAVARTL